MNSIHKNIIFLLTILFLLLSINEIFAEGFASETLVKTAIGYTNIDKLQVGDKVLCYNPEGLLVERPIIYTTQKNSEQYIQILIGDQLIKTAYDQKFYLPQENTWIEAQHIAISHTLLKNYPNFFPIITLHQVHQPTTLYMIAVADYHNFCVSTLDIQVHNFLPAIFFGLSWAFGGGIVFTGASVAAIATGLGVGIAMSKKNGSDNAEIKFGSSANCMKGIGGPDDDDNENQIFKINNMKEFFNKTEFGQKIENSVEKTNKLQQGQSVYQVKKDLPEYGLKKGDQFYLDAAHKDHLEVFRKNGTMKTVLNLNGTENIDKALRAIGRRLQ
jgi:hypothetical protein